MSPGLLWLWITWGGFASILVILLIYRSTLTMHEDDQLFLGESDAHMARDQMETLAKVNKITPVVQILGGACGLMLVVAAGLSIYQELIKSQAQ